MATLGALNIVLNNRQSKIAMKAVVAQDWTEKQVDDFLTWAGVHYEEVLSTVYQENLTNKSSKPSLFKESRAAQAEKSKPFVAGVLGLLDAYTAANSQPTQTPIGKPISSGSQPSLGDMAGYKVASPKLLETPIQKKDPDELWIERTVACVSSLPLSFDCNFLSRLDTFRVNQQQKIGWQLLSGCIPWQPMLSWDMMHPSGPLMNCSRNKCHRCVGFSLKYGECARYFFAHFHRHIFIKIRRTCALFC